MNGNHPDEISVNELKEQIDRGDDPFILDCREPGEFQISRVPHSILIPMGELRDRLDEVPKEGEIVVVCRTGRRSAMVTQFLRQEGYQARNLVGGVNRWVDRIDPSQPKY